MKTPATATSRSRYDPNAVFFWITWVVATSIAFWLGWETGGRDQGAVSKITRIPHNLYYLGFVGLVQTLVLWLWLRRSGDTKGRSDRAISALLLAWPFLSAVGFALGVFIGYGVTHVLALGGVSFGVVFGLCVGVCISSAQWLALRRTGLTARRWFVCSLVGWLIGEVISSLGYQGWIIPLTGASISAFTGLALSGLLVNHVREQIPPVEVMRNSA